MAGITDHGKLNVTSVENSQLLRQIDVGTVFLTVQLVRWLPVRVQLEQSTTKIGNIWYLHGTRDDT